MRVLVMDDDMRLLELLRQGLRAEGYAVDTVPDGLSGIQRAMAEAYDVLIIDVMMPGMNGYKVCAYLRSAGVRVPIVMLTAKDGEYDEAEGLETGADDYLVKPFSFVVLNARLRALVRRARPERELVQHLGDLEIDVAAKRCRRAGVEIALTGREFAILALLSEVPDTAVSKTAILEAVWDTNYEGSLNIVEVHISALRRKIDRPFGRRSIETVPGGGYRIRSDGN
ncbi:response regulator transcription factor [Streptomyces sp. NPDC059215]|uniref:response regulator transcription factor n=1 Tax=Streptomyces sp. NPDC059215 TaxID=3346772 RepID=UPI0036BB156D